jgi:hypothetical protein
MKDTDPGINGKTKFQYAFVVFHLFCVHYPKRPFMTYMKKVLFSTWGIKHAELNADLKPLEKEQKWSF